MNVMSAALVRNCATQIHLVCCYCCFALLQAIPRVFSSATVFFLPCNATITTSSVLRERVCTCVEVTSPRGLVRKLCIVFRISALIVMLRFSRRRLAGLVPAKIPVPPPVAVSRDGSFAAPEAQPKTTLALNSARAVVNRQPFNADEHVLLVDLDPAKDAVLFGTGREEFYQNVKAMKEVIVTYHRWEHRDNYYKWATRLLQFGCVAVLYDIMNNTKAKTLFRCSIDDYLSLSHADVEALDAKRAMDFAAARKTLAESPPNFGSVTAARAAEKATGRNANPAAAAAVPAARHPMDTLGREAARAKREADDVTATFRVMRASGGQPGGAVGANGSAAESEAVFSRFASSPTSVSALKQLRRVLLPQTDDYTSIVKEEILEYRTAKAAQLVHPA